jgi:hypothetical protein
MLAWAQFRSKGYLKTQESRLMFSAVDVPLMFH